MTHAPQIPCGGTPCDSRPKTDRTLALHLPQATFDEYMLLVGTTMLMLIHVLCRIIPKCTSCCWMDIHVVDCKSPFSTVLSHACGKDRPTCLTRHAGPRSDGRHIQRLARSPQGRMRASWRTQLRGHGDMARRHNVSKSRQAKAKEMEPMLLALRGNPPQMQVRQTPHRCVTGWNICDG